MSPGNEDTSHIGPDVSGDFTLTRAAGLARLADVIPRAGVAYTTGRNTDLGPGREPTTTALSPYLRRRLILEEEVIAAAVAAHGPELDFGHLGGVAGCPDQGVDG